MLPPLFEQQKALAEAAEALSPPIMPLAKAKQPNSPTGVVPAEKSKPKPTTMAIAFASLGLSPLLREPLLNALQCPEDADPEVLTALPEQDLQLAIDQVAIGDSVRPPSPFERGQLFLFFKKLRGLWDTSSPSSSSGQAQLALVCRKVPRRMP